MANVTLFVPDALKSKMDAHKDVRWSSAIRVVIEEKIADFEEAEKLARKSRLSQKDVDRISSEVDSASARHAEALLRETRR